MRQWFVLAALCAAAWQPLACSVDPGEESTADDRSETLPYKWGHGSSGHGSSGHSSSSVTTGTGTTTSTSTSATTSASTGTTTSSSGSGGGTAGGSGGIFQASEPWNTPVDQDPKSASSDTIINWLAANGGWGTGSLRIDFSINVLHADATTPFLPFTATSDFYSPDCDHVPFPVPAVGAVEGESGYACTQNGDCHLLVVHPGTNKLYEMWRANISGGTFQGGCTAVWDLGKSYPMNLRGDDCTSADAGGFPIAAMLFTADEIAAGHIDHAIRFILPNTRIRHGSYLHPGTHSTGATSGGASAPPYGVRFRLRASYPVQDLPAGAQVVARALQKYGMLLADGGNIALTAANDQFTQHKWSEVGVGTSSLSAIQVGDMEVVDMGTPVPYTGNCVRNP